jgi:hypothetical protein
MGYAANADAASRATAVKRWRDWVAQRTREGIVAQAPAGR